MQAGGFSLDLERTRTPGHATALAREAVAGGYELVIACGGDGTVSEVANGLAGSTVPMGVIPAGTVNIWAAEAGIPTDCGAAARALLRGVVREVDLGRAGDRYFLLMAGLGLDGAVARNLSIRMKTSLGRTAYLLAGMRTLPAFEGSRVNFIIDGERLERDAVWIVIGNTRLYGGLLTVTPDAKVDDGLLDLCIFSGRGFLSCTGCLAALLGGRHLRLKSVEYRKCQEVRVESAVPLPIQADGDFIGFSPRTFQVASKALHVMLPPGTSTRIFSRQYNEGRAA